MNEESGKKLKLINIVGLGVGDTIGTGIFVMTGFGIAFTGRSISLVVIVGCFFMLLAYWYNFAMPMMFVFRGGDYDQKKLLLGPILTGAVAWFTLLGAFGMSSYTVAIADYIIILAPSLADYESLMAFILMTVIFLFSIKGSRFLTLTQNMITIILLLALGLFVVFGLPHVDFANYLSATYDGGFFHDGLPGFISAVAIMGYACMGATTTPISMAAVTEKPKRTIPMAILCITCIISVLYALMMIVAGGVLPYDAIAGENISVTAAVVLSTPLFLFFVIGGGICAISSTLFSSVAMYRYPLIQIADDGWLPAIFKKQTKTGYPYVCFIAFYLVSIFPIVTGMSLDAIISIVMVPSMIVNIYANLACVTMPNKFPEQWEKRSIRMPKLLFQICCVLGTVCSIIVGYELFVELTLSDMIVCLVIVALMFGLSWVRIRQGAVSKETLDAQKQAVIDEAIAIDVD